jgi:hypothetical protein
LDGRLGHGNSPIWYSTATIGGTFNVMDCEGDHSDGVGEVGIDVGVRLLDSWLSEGGAGDGGDGSKEDNGVVQERGERRRLHSSSPALNS